MIKDSETTRTVAASNRSIIVIHLLAVFGLIFFCSLGLWQLDRAGQKQHLQQSFNNSEQQTLKTITTVNEFSSADDFQQIVLQTQWLPEATFLLDSQIHNGQVGVYVVTPVLLQDSWLLVNRGFLPLPANRKLPTNIVNEILTPHGAVSLVGKKWLWPQAGLSLDATVEKKQGVDWWSNLTSSLLEQQYQVGTDKILNKIVLLNPDQLHGFQRDFQIVNSSFGPNKHRAYAIQWFSFAVIIIILLIGYWLRLRKNTQALQSTK